MNEYIVTFKISAQISPDHWDVFNPTMKVTESTTVKEIEEFYRKYDKISAVEVKLIQLQK